MRIKGNGNVGIGTSNPLSQLSIKPSSQGVKITLCDNGSTTDHYGFGCSNYQLNYHVDTTSSNHVFYAQGKNGNGYELMRIQGNGNVAIGTSNATERLHVIGNVRIEGILVVSSTKVSGNLNTNTLTIGNIPTQSVQLELSTDGAKKLTTSTWSTGSDERLKEDIQDADLNICYTTAKAIKLKYFKWRDDLFTDEEIQDRHKLGFIAQEIESVFPKAVVKSNFRGIEDCRSLNNEQIYHTFFGAFQKLMEKVEALELKNIVLEAEIQKLKI